MKSYTVYISGIVQGVGMRPHIYNMAKIFNLKGWVNNQGTSVVIEIVGRKKNIRDFLTSLMNEPPFGAKIYDIKIKAKKYCEYESFTIISSSRGSYLKGFIPPDSGICNECIKEIGDNLNKRYRYPFTNCVNCGPRYSILKALPYDRRNTSMVSFKMCSSCRNEYENSDNRRFHAQTNCCPECGPNLILYDNKRNIIDSINPIETVRSLILEGNLIAIKGIGGYHLTCNGLDEKAITLLRQRKMRPDRPLAIMAANLEAAKSICRITCKEEEILTSRHRPIVLIQKRYPELLPSNIAPGVKPLGVMLPYTPIHHLLFYEGLQYLVMTSGNVSGMPICYRDEEARDKLKDIADFFLIHNREICTAIDDSVVRVVHEKEFVSRSARGYAPLTFQMKGDTEILGMGGEQKSSICLLHNGYANTTQYLGNLDDLNSFQDYLRIINRMQEFFDANPKIIAHDLHPGYLSTQYAIKQSVKQLPIQHHHAHMAACMAEHGLKGDAIGIIYDGTGMGTDGAIWGGEFFVGSIAKVSRVGHWKYVTLQGGDSAVKQPWKTLVSYLYDMTVNSKDLSINCHEFLDSIDYLRIKAIQNAIKHQFNCFNSSSMGRLFDCVSALITKRTNITYDAQGAIELESIIEADITDYYYYSIKEKDEILEIGYEEVISGILTDIKEGKPASYISAKFHNTVCEATIDCACRIRSKYCLNDVVLSGGVFENSYLLTSLMKIGKQKGFDIYCSMQIPTNDGGIAFGQVVIADALVKEGKYVFGSPCKDSIH